MVSMYDIPDRYRGMEPPCPSDFRSERDFELAMMAYKDVRSGRPFRYRDRYDRGPSTYDRYLGVDMALPEPKKVTVDKPKETGITKKQKLLLLAKRRNK